MTCNCYKYEKALAYVSKELNTIKYYMSHTWLPEVLHLFNNEDLLMLISNVEKLELQIDSLDNIVTDITHSIRLTNH